MAVLEFNAAVRKAGQHTFIDLPADPNEVWGDKRTHHVTGTIDGHKVRGALQQDTAGYALALGAAWLRDHPVAPDSHVAVVLAAEGPQFDDLAADLAAALNAEPEARAVFEALATFYRNGYVQWIEGARRAEARAARISEAVELLKAGRKQR